MESVVEVELVCEAGEVEVDQSGQSSGRSLSGGFFERVERRRSTRGTRIGISGGKILAILVRKTALLVLKSMR